MNRATFLRNWKSLDELVEQSVRKIEEMNCALHKSRQHEDFEGLALVRPCLGRSPTYNCLLRVQTKLEELMYELDYEREMWIDDYYLVSVPEIRRHLNEEERQIYEEELKESDAERERGQNGNAEHINQVMPPLDSTIREQKRS